MHYYSVGVRLAYRPLFASKPASKEQAASAHVGFLAFTALAIRVCMLLKAFTATSKSPRNILFFVPSGFHSYRPNLMSYPSAHSKLSISVQ